MKCNTFLIELNYRNKTQKGGAHAKVYTNKDKRTRKDL
jgi:hypothetical protein